MRTLLLRSGPALLSTHDCVGSPRPLLAVLRAALARRHGAREVATLTLTHDALTHDGMGAAGRAAPRTLAEDVATLAPVVAERSDGCALVHALDLPSAAAALAARRHTGVPVVVRDQPAARESVAGGRSEHAAWSAVLRAADGVIVPTTQDARAARAAGVPAGRITVCTDTALVAGAQCEQPAAAPAPSPSTEGAYLLGLSGVPELAPVRAGLVAALQADRSLRIVLAGCAEDGERAEHRRDLVGRATARRVADRLVLRELLPPGEMLELVDGSAAVVATRSDPSCALSALVAMHRARPVVGVRSVCADDVLVDGITGRLVGPQQPTALAKTLVRTASDPFRQLSWGLAGLDRVSSRYDREAVMGAMLQAHEQAAQRVA